MVERWIGIKPSKDSVSVVVAIFDDGVLIDIVLDTTWKIPLHNGIKNLFGIFQHITSYIQNNNITHAVVKGSVPGRSCNAAILSTAEVRGTVIAALQSCDIETHTTVKANVSKKVGERNVDEYVDDDDYWNDLLQGRNLKKFNRETFLMIITKRKK